MSSLLHVVCISVLCSAKALQSIDLGNGIQIEKTCVGVWLLVCSSEVGAPFHYAQIPLKTDTRQKLETEFVRMYRHDKNTEERSCNLTTLCLSIYSHSQSHFSDEPIKEMHTILFTLPHVTHTVNTRTNQTDA